MSNEKKEVKRLPCIDKTLHKDFKAACSLLELSMIEASEEAVSDWIKKKQKEK